MSRLLSYCLLFLGFVNWAAPVHSILHRYAAEQHHYVIVIRSPCDDFYHMAEENFFEWRQKPMAVRQCRQSFKDVSETAIGELRTCSIDPRVERDLLSTAANILVTTLQVVTNFLATKSYEPEKPRWDSIKDFSDGFDWQRSSKELIPQFLDAVDANYHSSPENFGEAPSMLPMSVWAAAKIHTEIATQASNIRQILDYCQLRKVATKELAELAGLPPLFSLDNAKTKLSQLIVSEDNRGFQITFEAEKELPWGEIEYGLAIALSVSIILLSLLIKLCRSKNNETNNNVLPLANNRGVDHWVS